MKIIAIFAIIKYNTAMKRPLSALAIVVFFASTACDELSKYFPQEEEEIPATDIELNRERVEMNVGDTFTLVATLTPSDATDTVEWGSSDEEVASVEDGLVTALKEGTARIEAKAGATAAFCSITVKKGVVAVESIGLDKQSLELELGKSALLTATVLPENATDKTVEWQSKNVKVATVANGKVTAVAEGETMVTAKAGSKEVSCKVTVKSSTVAVTSVNLSKGQLTLQPGQTEQLTAKVLPENATDKTVKWSSSNTAVATVQEGKVLGVAGGECTVTASAGGKEATCKVTVKIPVSSITLSETEFNLEIGASKQVKATVLPENASEKTVTWTTSMSSVATVKDGLITAVTAGEAQIVASAGGKTAECKVHVVEPVYEEVVDLGLSVKWRAWNLGATKPQEFGDYYAWGELEPYYTGLDVSKSSGWYATGWKRGKTYGYNWQSNRFRISGFIAWSDTDPLKVSKYNTIEGRGTVDGKTVLDPEDDAAHVALGGKWRMPTKEEWDELLDGCTSEFVRNAWVFHIDGVMYSGHARRFTSKTNGNSILLPIAGYFFNTECYAQYGTQGSYWSSTLVPSHIEGTYEYAPGEAYYLSLYGSDTDVRKMDRFEGISIRPVMDKE